MSRTRRWWLASAATAGTLSLGLLAAAMMPASTPAAARASARLPGPPLAGAGHPAPGRPASPAGGQPASAAGPGPSSPAGTRPAAPGAPRPPARAGRVALPGSHPAWAVASRRVTARPVTRGAVAVRVYLAGRDMRGLAAFATAVSTPGNPAYRHYLTPAQARARFGTAPAQVATVRSWLRGAHMAVTAVHDPGAAGAYLAARGTVRAAARAFGVTFGQYRGPDGRIGRAPAGPASIPAAAAADVLGVAGLSTAPAGVTPAQAGAASAARQPATPCSRYYGQRTAAGQPAAYGRHWPWRVCGYIPSQLRSAYNVTGDSGQGQTIAIVDPYRSPTLLADADRYARETGDVPLRSDQYQQYQADPFTSGGPRACNARGWYGEQTLDLEAVHGLAPGAVIRYVAAGSCHDRALISALSLIVNRHLASIVSNSWGGLEEHGSLAAAYNSVFQAGATEGIGFYFSSGDAGYNAPAENQKSSRIQVDFPTSSPWVTSVGGTSLAIGSGGQYLWETSWGSLADPVARGGRSWRYPPPGRYPEGYGGSGGGGVSTRFQQPSYQRGVVPLSLATQLPGGRRSAVAMRVVPDVAAVANPVTGMLVGQTVPRGGTSVFTRQPVGGTSLACPVFAAIQADVQQVTGYPLGFANPAIYARAGTGAFHDVTDHPLGSVPLSAVDVGYEHPDTRTGPLVPSLTALGINGRGAAALRAVRGYDDATGVGSPWLYLQSFRS